MSVRLQVPFVEKDEAKRLGAKWNFREKYWYCPGELTDELRRWYVPEPGEEVPETAQPQVEEQPAFEVPFENGNENREEVPFEEATETRQQDPYKTVTEINTMINQVFVSTSRFRTVMVKGEVTNYSGPNRGNYYFDIKDEHSLLPCFMWASDAMAGLNFRLEKGQQIAITGTIEYFTERGRSQLHARHILNLGEGAANAAFQLLKERLRLEGLFDADHKKPIPMHPEKVGIITSAEGQAIKDIYKIAKKRNPYVQLYLFPVNVQGRNAVPSILKGIEVMDRKNMDVLIVGRGGGSDEELKAYNEEAIARAVYMANTPIVSAVGHEGHWTLIDETADFRVATPSEAAEKVCPDIMSDVRRLQGLTDSMYRSMYNNLNQRILRYQKGIALLESNNPEAKLKRQQERLNTLIHSMRVNMQTQYDKNKHRCDMAIARLHGLSPTAKLINGFGYISLNDKPITSINEVKESDEIQVIIHDGSIRANVTAVEKNNSKK